MFEEYEWPTPSDGEDWAKYFAKSWELDNYEDLDDQNEWEDCQDDLDRGEASFFGEFTN